MKAERNPTYVSSSSTSDAADLNKSTVRAGDRQH